MSGPRSIFAALAAAALPASPLAGQDHAVYVFATGGGVNDRALYRNGADIGQDVSV